MLLLAYCYSATLKNMRVILPKSYSSRVSLHYELLEQLEYSAQH